MATALFYFGADIAALTAVLLTGAGCLISNPRSFNARIFACVTVSSACYLVGRIAYALPADVQVSDHAVDLLRRTALAEGLHSLPEKPVLHGDNGSTMKATTVLAMIHWLGLKASHSRPRVSDDNAFVEALFRTAKYRPQYPAKGFATLEDARRWASRFVSWYNHEHRHSGIRYVSPAERHAGQDLHILARRHELYLKALAVNPRRWARNTRNWQPVAAVTLNPERDSVVNAALPSANASSANGSSSRPCRAHAALAMAPLALHHAPGGLTWFLA